MPDAAGAVSRLHPRLVPPPTQSSGFDVTKHVFDTSTVVRFRSPSRPTPDAINVAPFAVTLTTPGVDPAQLTVVCRLPLQGDDGGPTPISRAASLQQIAVYIGVLLRVRGALC
jgi:hypothetical protein